MVLVRCRKCGQQVSSQVARCPSCGTRVDLGEEGEAEATHSRRKLMVGAALLVALVLAFPLWRLVRGRVAENRASRAVQTEADIERLRDSARALELLALPPEKATVLEADNLVHRHGFEILHAAAHEQAVNVRLDSAARFLAVSGFGPGPIASAREVLGGAAPPLLPAQQARRDLLLRIAGDKTAAGAQPDPAAARAAFGTSYEAELRVKRVEARVSTQGAGNTTLHLAWRLVSRELAHQLGTDASLRQRLRAMGFTRLEITDGYDATWSWDLSS